MVNKWETALDEATHGDGVPVETITLADQCRVRVLVACTRGQPFVSQIKRMQNYFFRFLVM